MALPINSASLINEMRVTLSQLNEQIEAATADVERQIKTLPPQEQENVTVYMWKYSTGQFVIGELLVAKAQILAGIAQLQAAQVRAR